MAKFFPDRWDPASPSSETVVRDALETLDSEWLVFSNIRWLDPDANTPDGETDFVVVHPAHGVLVLEVKGGAFELSGGEWSTIDRRGVSRPLGRRGPFQQATEAKHQLKRRLKERAPEAAGRVGQAVCFTSGAPGGDLGLEAPAEIVLSNMDLRHIEERLIRAAQRLGISDPSQPLSRSEIRALTSVLAPSGSVRRDEAQEVAVVRLRQDRLSEHRLRLTVGHIAGLERLRGSRCVAVYGAAGTGKTVLALRRARELLDQGASVLVLCTSAQLVGYYRSVLQAEWPGRLAVGRSSMLLDPGTEVFAADAVIIDEAQNLSAEHLERVPKMVREDGALDLLCDLGQIRDPERRAGWTIPFDHDRYFLLENLRNSEEIVLVLARLGYEGVVGPAGASHAEVEMVECSNGRQCARRASRWRMTSSAMASSRVS